jgi:hypothetical protein
MAKRATVKPWASKPAAKSTPTKRTRSAPKVKIAPDTQEDLLAKIAIEVAAVEGLMAAPRKYDISISRYAHGKMGEHVRSFEDLMGRLNKLINPTFLPDLPTAESLTREMLYAEPGTVPTWIQRGEFLVWIDYVPCRCVWGGLIDNSADILAVDPGEPFPSAAGAGGVGGRTILPEHATPVDLFRANLLKQTVKRNSEWRNGREKDLGPLFKLHRLSPEGQAAAEKTLALPEYAWLVKALARGPVNAIPLPEHLKFVQMSWSDYV